MPDLEKRRSADMVERKEYLDQAWAWKDELQIKVVAGIHGCGKSVLLKQYQQRLLANRVTPVQIISINFDNLDYEPLKDYMTLYNYLKERLCADKMTYIFFDEVQEVPSFEKVVDSLYIKGSNAYMPSNEFATLLGLMPVWKDTKFNIFVCQTCFRKLKKQRFKGITKNI